jgi:hypothetical protein
VWVCGCVWVWVYYTHTHTHTHTLFYKATKLLQDALSLHDEAVRSVIKLNQSTKLNHYPTSGCSLPPRRSSALSPFSSRRHRQLKSPHIVGLFCPYSRSLMTRVWSTQAPTCYQRAAIVAYASGIFFSIFFVFFLLLRAVSCQGSMHKPLLKVILRQCSFCFYVLLAAL